MMGGLGSGPRVRSERELVEDCLAIDIRQLCWDGAGVGRARVVCWESQGREVASAHYRLSGGKLIIMMVGTDVATGRRGLELQVVETTTTPYNYGGARRWLVCPGRVKELEDMGAWNVLGKDGSCGRRVAKLYRPSRGEEVLVPGLPRPHLPQHEGECRRAPGPEGNGHSPETGAAGPGAALPAEAEGYAPSDLSATSGRILGTGHRGHVFNNEALRPDYS